MTMTHPGLPLSWALAIGVAMFMLLIAILLLPPGRQPKHVLSLAHLPAIGHRLSHFLQRPLLLLVLKLLFVGLFILIIVAGLYGTPIAERNFATAVTWNIWWAGLILAVFFLSTAWCGVCPWDTLSSWLVRQKLWGRSVSNFSLKLKVPKKLRNLWLALLMFIVLTWLELGVGITTNPQATASLALFMVVLAVLVSAIYEDKAFCRFFCPVGRTVGAYSQLSMLELRPIEPDLCAQCTTLECYKGTDKIAPCPTHLVMGRLNQSAYCTACGNCMQSCPQHNISWQIRPPSREVMQDARPRWDEAWFILGLLALTAFHGITMLEPWESALRIIAQQLGDSGQLLLSFSLGLLACMTLVFVLYTATIKLTHWLTRTEHSFKRLFSSFSFALLPLAFAYHLAHNLNHLIRESDGLGALLLNPLGIGTEPLSMMEKHMRHLDTLISQDSLFFVQAFLMVFGFWITLRVIRSRGASMLPGARWQLMPVIGFAIAVNTFHIWVLMQPMIMRM